VKIVLRLVNLTEAEAEEFQPMCQLYI